MLNTHISHFDLEQIDSTEYSSKRNTCFIGDLGNCKRMAAAHGLTWNTENNDRPQITYWLTDERGASHGHIHTVRQNVWVLAIETKYWEQN